MMFAQSAFARESVALLKIAAPLIAAYLGEYAMLLTSKIVVGHIGYRELAAVGLASSVSFELIIIFMGMLSVVGVLIAQAEARRDKAAAGDATRQAIGYAILVSIPLSVVVWNLGALLALTGQDPEIVALAEPYLRVLSTSVMPIILFNVLRSYVAALAKTASIMVITLAAVAVNYALTVALVHGTPMTPPLGLVGAGLSISVVSWLMLVALTIYIARRSDLRGYGLFRGRFRVNFSTWRELTWLGIPVAGIIFLEGGLFMSVSILSGLLGAKTLAAFEILMSWVSVPFVIALGLAEATLVRVAYGTGLEDYGAARRAGIVGMVLGSSIVLVLAAVPILVPEAIVNVFLDPNDEGRDDVASLVVRLLVIVALFQVFDGLQAIAARALRSLKDTMVPLVLAAFGYWVCGVGGGYFLAFVLDWGAAGLWWGMAAGLITTGSLLAFRFVRLTDVRRRDGVLS